MNVVVVSGTVLLSSVGYFVHSRLELAFIKDFVVPLIKKSLDENQLMQALLGASIMSFGGWIYYAISQQIYQSLRKRLWRSVEMISLDDNYNNVLAYITKRLTMKTSEIQASTLKKQSVSWRDYYRENTFGKAAPKIEFSASKDRGSHILDFEGHKIVISFHKDNATKFIMDDDNKPLNIVTMTLSCWGRNDNILRKLIQEAVADAYKQSKKLLNIYVTNPWGYWLKATSCEPRPAESVILDSTLKEELLEDARKFLSSKQWYTDMGIPYRRGYLLYGPPGCGKTSFAKVLAHELSINICMLSLSNKRINDSRLAGALREAPAQCMIMLEDVDAVFVKRTAVGDSNTKASVSFSGLLNALDGVASQVGRIYFLTTNHIEKLDPALIRPGRCDVKVAIKRATQIQARKLFMRFYPEADEALVNKWTNSIPEFEFSMAQLQGHLLECKHSAAEAVNKIYKLIGSKKAEASQEELQRLDWERLSIFKFLKRAGLEKWTWLFEKYGFYKRIDLCGLKPDRVKSWHPEFILGSPDFNRIESLLNAEKEAVEQYELAEVSQIKDIFIATFIGPTKEHIVGKDSAMESDDLLGPPGMERGSSAIINSLQPVSGLKQDPLRSVPITAGGLEKLSKEFISILSKNGRGLVSIYQVRTHLERYYDSAKLAVERAPDLIALRVSGAEFSKEMTILEFLWRVGMEKHYWTIRDYCSSDNVLALMEGKKDKWHKGIHDVSEREFLKALLCGDDSGPERYRKEFFTPSFSFLVQRITTGLKFSDPDARSLARKITNNILSCSTWRLEKYINAGPLEDFTCLLPPKAVPREDVSSTWIYQWLKKSNLERFAYRFTNLGISTETLFTKPEIYEPDYDGMGVIERRELQLAIKELREEIEKNQEKEDEKNQEKDDEKENEKEDEKEKPTKIQQWDQNVELQENQEDAKYEEKTNWV